MSIKVLKASWHLDSPEGFRCRFITSSTEREIVHSHEFYEIFLVQTPGIIHTVNGVTSILQKGELVFIRPTDEHHYRHTKPYNFINIAFSEEIANELFSYIGESLDLEHLLNSPVAPSTKLFKFERQNLEQSIYNLNALPYNDSNRRRLFCKKILADIFADFFFDRKQSPEEVIPKWLEETTIQMHKPSNFIEGIPAMERISGKSYSHLAKSTKKYFNRTVTEYINDIKLNNAANLLRQTNLSVIDISIECGFASINYFHKCFKAKFGITPRQLRVSSFGPSSKTE